MPSHTLPLLLSSFLSPSHLTQCLSLSNLYFFSFLYSIPHSRVTKPHNLSTFLAFHHNHHNHHHHHFHQCQHQPGHLTPFHYWVNAVRCNSQVMGVRCSQPASATPGKRLSIKFSSHITIFHFFSYFPLEFILYIFILIFFFSHSLW